MKNGKETKFGVNSASRMAKAGVLEVTNSEGKCLLAANDSGV